jgi:hypothetical protein
MSWDTVNNAIRFYEVADSLRAELSLGRGVGVVSGDALIGG